MIESSRSVEAGTRMIRCAAAARGLNVPRLSANIHFFKGLLVHLCGQRIGLDSPGRGKLSSCRINFTFRFTTAFHVLGRFSTPTQFVPEAQEYSAVWA